VVHEAPHGGERHPAEPPQLVEKPKFRGTPVRRRTVLAGTGAVAAAASSMALIERLATVPQRAYADVITTATPSDIQFDLDAFIPPAITLNGILFRFPPVHTLFVTYNLGGVPTATDQAILEGALNRIESVYPWSPSGVFTHTAYGGPYLNNLNARAGIVDRAVPFDVVTGNRAQRPAVAAPTDVVSGNGIVKDRFNVAVNLELNWALFIIRSDNLSIANDVNNWLFGSNVLKGVATASPRFSVSFTRTSTRHMFMQRGLPRQVADQQGFSFRTLVNSDSPMWMSFGDQQVNGSAPASRTTYLGSGRTDMTAGRYLDNAAQVHLSHNIQDLWQFFDVAEALGADGQPVFGDDAAFEEKVQYMFHAPDIANATDAAGHIGPTFLPNEFRGTGYAARTAQGIGTNIDPDTGQPERRMGHLSTLQRSSRDANGNPLHARLDGPGFDTFDTSRTGVPSRFFGRSLPKLHFSVFHPTSDFFSTMRRNQASLDLQNQFGVDPSENGLERFITSTRRQNFIVPPRRHRSFPLVEL
jgi:hypothetical protein